jgi:hypothetical protein
MYSIETLRAVCSTPMRAYPAADKDSDSFITRREFGKLLQYLVYFNHLWDVFDSIDSNHDHRLSRPEFLNGCQAVGLQLSPAEATAEFALADKNGGGFVLFDEFSRWCALKQVVQEDHEDHED